METGKELPARVARNIRTIREDRGLTLDALSTRLAELGHPILKSGLSKIERGARGIDVSDLVALAVALETNPNALLLGRELADRLWLAPSYAVPARAVWLWARGEIDVDELSDMPLARFAGPEGPPVKRFIRETNPAESPIRLTLAEWQELQPWIRDLSDISMRMQEAGLDRDVRSALLDHVAGGGVSRFRLDDALTVEPGGNDE